MAGIDVGDIVRILSTPDTIAAGFADRTGIYYGWTTPSVTGVAVIGSASEDFAVGITFDDGVTAWFGSPLVVATEDPDSN